MSHPEHVVIVGASLAGLRTAEALRRNEYAGTITLVGAEPHLPYNRPPLSKQVLRDGWDPAKVTFRDHDKIAELDLDLRLGVAAERLDPTAHEITLADGSVVAYDAVVLATGARARQLPGTEDIAGILTLRTLDDALALRDAATSDANVAVIGAGFIGMEVAASLVERVASVTVIEALQAPLVRGLGEHLGNAIGDLHRSRGVDVLTDTRVAGFDTNADGQVTAVRIESGDPIAADVVVVGIGAAPATEWLDGSGLTIDDGVVCDEHLAAVGVDDVWAVGDLARWDQGHPDGPRRFEHWTTAADHGAAVAANLLAEPAARVAHVPVPFVWSDQFDAKIQIVGQVGDRPLVPIRGAIGDESFLVVATDGDLVVGAVGLNEPRWTMMLRMALGRGPLTVDDARSTAGE